MRPYDDLRGGAPLPGQVIGERVQGVGHVAIAQVPGRNPPAEHRPVVLLGRPRILLCVEQLVLGDQAVPARVLRGMPLQVDELLDYRLLAFLARPESRSEPVDLGVVATELLKTGVTLTGTGRRRRSTRSR